MSRHKHTTPNQAADVRRQIQSIRLSRGWKAFQKNQAIAALVTKDLKDKGFFVAAEDHYFFWRERRRLFSLKEIEFAAQIEDWYGINRSEQEWQYLIGSLITEAILRGRKSEIYRFARYQGGNLYVSRFDGNMYRLDGKSVALIPNGSDGVLFKDDPEWQPYEYLQTPVSGLVFKTLIEPVNFGKKDSRLAPDEQRLLFQTWLYTLFFESLMATKPILVFIGQWRSGKSCALRSVLKCLFGEKADVIDMAKNKEDAFIAAVSSAYLIVWDNVDDKIGWLNDHLASLSTGGSIKLRKLYTTNEEITFHPRVFQCITSRTPHFRREDVADRLLLFRVDQRTEFKPEAEIARETLAARNQLWTEMLNTLNRIVAALKNDAQMPRRGFRMADFAKLAWRIADIEGQGERLLQILEKMESEKSVFALEEEPLYLALSTWLEKPENRGREVLMKELFEELKALSGSSPVSWPYANPQALGTRLASVRSSLERFFEIKDRTAPHNQKRWSFRPVSSIGSNAEAVRLESSLDPWEAAECAGLGLLGG